MDNATAAEAALEVMAAAMAAQDADQFTSVYAEDARVWHNTSRTEQGKEENRAFLAATMQQFRSMEYRDIRRVATADGMVQQHVLFAEMENGQMLELPACLIVAMAGDEVARIDEYFNAPT